MEAVCLYWVTEAQAEILDELENALSGRGNFRRLNVKKRNSIYVATGRTELCGNIYSNKELIILPGQHRFAKLYATYIHNRAHRGICADIAMIRTVYWTVGVQRLIRSIKFNCVICLIGRTNHGSITWRTS